MRKARCLPYGQVMTGLDLVAPFSKAIVPYRSGDIHIFLVVKERQPSFRSN